MSTVTEIPSVLKDLADATSTQTRVANRHWIVMLAVSFFVAFPSVEEGKVDLPFKLGKVAEAHFSLVGLVMVCVLAIAFCSAHAQMLRVQQLIHRAIREDQFGEMPAGHDARDFLDALRVPSLTRVAPLSQLARGENLFFIDATEVSARRKATVGLYYLFLKALSVLVYFGLPSVALLLAIARYRSASAGLLWQDSLAGFLATGALLALIQLVIYEIFHIAKALKAVTT